ncbi:hypothetical protein FIBSPDRAFT_768204, partial [Athelia psychrophila]
ITARWLYVFTHHGTGFGDSIGRRVKLTKVSVNDMPNEPERKEGQVVAEITLEESVYTSPDKRFRLGFLSTLPITTVDCAMGGGGNVGLSQAIHTIFHAVSVPAC